MDSKISMIKISKKTNEKIKCKNGILELKTEIKNSTFGFNRRLDTLQKKINELKNKSVENIQTEWQRGKNDGK